MTHVNPTLLLTRPRPQADRFAVQCRALLGAEDVVISPVLTIKPRGGAVDLAGVAGVLLSSENGARVLAQAADVAGVLAWCVGDRTAAVARDLGMQAVSAGGTADDLVAMVLRARPKGPVLHAHGAETRGDVAQRLAAGGLTVTARVLYDQVETGLTAEAKALLAGTGDVVVPLFSPRSARLFAAAAQGTQARLSVVALSPAVAQAWAVQRDENFTVAARPDAHHMLKTIATIWTRLTG